MRGRWILFRDPGRAECIAGEPATIAELKTRFAHSKGSKAGDSMNEFAAFVVRQAGLALEIAEWGLIGRRYKAPRFVAESLRSSPSVQIRPGPVCPMKPAARLRNCKKNPLEYMKELIAVPSSLFIDLRASFDSWVMRLSYDGNRGSQGR